MTLVWRPGFQFDADASTYIEAVEAADTQALETGVRYAINDFVIGCKADGIWSAIKASCILSGARTLAGALIPLAGTAPTNVGPFVSGDYNRKTGLIGNGSSKYLNSNRNNNADPQNNFHMSILVSSPASFTSAYIGAGPATNETGASNIGRASNIFFRNHSSGFAVNTDPQASSGFMGTSRNNSANFTLRLLQRTDTSATASESPFNGNITVFASGEAFLANARLAFYSIGESLNLAALDARVSALITAFGVAIP